MSCTQLLLSCTEKKKCSTVNVALKKWYLTQIDSSNNPIFKESYLTQLVQGSNSLHRSVPDTVSASHLPNTILFYSVISLASLSGFLKLKSSELNKLPNPLPLPPCCLYLSLNSIYVYSLLYFYFFVSLRTIHNAFALTLSYTFSSILVHKCNENVFIFFHIFFGEYSQ